MDAQDRKPERRVFVGNLDYHATTQDIIDVIGEAGLGTVVDVFFPKDKNRKPPKLVNRKRLKKEPVNYGCAFIQFTDKASADFILTKKDLTMNGRVLYFCQAQRNV